MYHAIIINKQFIDETFPEKFKIFAKKTDGNWIIYAIEIEDKQLESFISEVQINMNEGKWYAHAYNNKELIVIFKEKVFKVTSDKSTWSEILDYGRSLNIPEEQLDFQPNNLADEKDYFAM